MGRGAELLHIATPHFNRCMACRDARPATTPHTRRHRKLEVVENSPIQAGCGSQTSVECLRSLVVRLQRQLLLQFLYRRCAVSFLYTHDACAFFSTFAKRAYRCSVPAVWNSLSTRSSAIAEGPRDALCQLKSCQLPRNSAETTYTTSPDQIDGMKLAI